MKYIVSILAIFSMLFTLTAIAHDEGDEENSYDYYSNGLILKKYENNKKYIGVSCKYKEDNQDKVVLNGTITVIKETKYNTIRNKKVLCINGNFKTLFSWTTLIKRACQIELNDRTYSILHNTSKTLSYTNS
jgi:predicted transcriptional regulator YheO